MKTYQMRTSKGYLSELAAARKSATATCILADSEAGTGAGKLYSGKREGGRCALMGGCCHGKTVGQQTRSRASYGIG